MRISLLILISSLLLAGGCASMKKGNSSEKEQDVAATLAGTWVLDLIPYPQGTIDSLYASRKPELTFEPATGRFSGYNGCNNINGPLVGDQKSISFKGDIAMTKMGCSGQGEAVFMEHLKKINRYNVSADGKTLTMIQGDIALLRFHRK